MPETVRVYGRADLPAGVETDLWSLGGVYPWPQTALPVRVRAGGNAADSPSGAGARLLLVSGLDDAFMPIQEILVPAGAAQSAQTAQSFRRIRAVQVVYVGTYTGSNVGNIVIETTAGAAVGHIAAGVGTAHMTHYTVPADRKALFVGAFVAVPGSKPATLRIKIRLNAEITTPGITSAALTVTEFTEFLGSERVTFSRLLAELAPRTDVWFTGEAVVGSGNDSACSGEYLLELWP